MFLTGAALAGVAVALAPALAAAGGIPGPNPDAPGQIKKDNPPLILDTYKSFFVGGQCVTKPDGTVRLDGQAYVEAFIPHIPGPAKKFPPIVMTHPSLSATIWLQRANGDEGWAILFARAGYPVYIVDPPGTGRAPRDRTY